MRIVIMVLGMLIMLMSINGMSHTVIGSTENTLAGAAFIVGFVMTIASVMQGLVKPPF